MYSTREQKTFKILESLALNGQLYQKQLVEKTGTSYRNLIRQLQLLQNAGLIRIARTEPSSKKGKEQNIWELTFQGLLVFLTNIRNFESELDQIAQNNKDKWLIFKEWQTLTKDPEVKGFLINRIALYCLQHFGSVNLKTLAKLAQLHTPLGLFKVFEDLYRHEATLNVLCLDDVFYHADVLFTNDKQEYGNYTGVKLWKILASNATFKEFLEKLFETENIRHKKILEFQKWLYNST
ncbi:MAG: hypothetical protein QXZ02_03825 [Candidatus Bathyarchaeia archaeon]